MRVRDLVPFAALILPSTLSLAQSPTPIPVPPIPAPAIPQRLFAIPEFGARGDGKSLCTGALKEAVSAASKAGGGIVLVPAGEASGNVFLTGSFSLASNVELRIQKGATLRFSANPDDFPIKSTRHEDALFCHNAHDVAITGDGTIDGNGNWWWELYAGKDAKKMPRRPNLLDFSNCTRLRLENLRILNSPSTTIQLQECNDVSLDHLQVSAPETSPNTDGVAFSGHNIAITNSSFDVGDDDLCAKPTGDGSPDRPQCADIQIANCTLLHGKGIVIGGQTSGCLRNMSVSNCTLTGTQYGLRMRSERGRGGLVENVSYDHITMTDVKFPIYLSSFFPIIPKTAAEEDESQPLTPTTPLYRNISFSNITATGSLTAGSFVGLPEQPMQNITLTNLDIRATHSMEITHAREIHFVNCHITVNKGKPTLTRDAQVTGLDTLSDPTNALP